MTGYERFDVVKALFPFIDVPLRKPRPVLVVSGQAFNLAHAHLVGAMITTGTGSWWPSDYVIQDLAAAGLKHRSIVRFKIFTLPFASIGQRIGTLAQADRAPLSVALDAVLCGSGP